MDDRDTKPDSKSPSGADPHNSYGLVPQDGSQGSKSQPSETKAQSLSPSGAEPHDSYGLAPDSSTEKKSSGSKTEAIADDPTYNQPTKASSGDKAAGAKDSPANSRSKL
ncbi:hypothetical protein H2198_003150 [Neophaeococcomyces mojaviensis]|uniref:Uncharacterized protein n=1 Tax=Neophaeococcomyces mojaviensis TaxID=3383035 RepID=A0ACC3ACN8_9EURO|nr:hypothetical protein H2198_003150 [Knufia sp. JES_112]